MTGNEEISINNQKWNSILLEEVLQLICQSKERITPSLIAEEIFGTNTPENINKAIEALNILERQGQINAINKYTELRNYQFSSASK